jgi:hypothetical protein
MRWSGLALHLPGGCERMVLMWSQATTSWVLRVRHGLARSFVDRFGPKWRHSDPAVRLAALSGPVTAHVVFGILRRGEPDVREAVIARLFQESSLLIDLLPIISRGFRQDPAKDKLGALVHPAFLNRYVERLIGTGYFFLFHYLLEEGWLRRLPADALSRLYSYYSMRHGERFTVSEQCGRGPASPGCGTHPLYREVAHVMDCRKELDAIICEYRRRGYESPEHPELPFRISALDGPGRALFPPTWNKS